MKLLNHIQDIYFIGIGGIGMSALARFFKEQGKNVYGYDRVSTELTQNLEKSGISIHYQDDIHAIPQSIDLVIYTPAIKPETNQILSYCIDKNMPLLKRSQVLRLITENIPSVCIGGTHGKTTTSTLLAHILRDSHFGCNAFLGGVSVNYNTNFWSHPNPLSIIEADEYDRSFLQLFPTIGVITSMDADHLDIYHTVDEMQNAYVQFAKQISSDGLLIHKYGLPKVNEFGNVKKMSYHLHDTNADIVAQNIHIDQDMYCYDVIIKDKIILNCRLPIHGQHNIENSLAAIAIADTLGVSEANIKSALVNFKGIKRRFEYHIREKHQVLIDDYAHHPQEIQAFVKGLNDFYPAQQVLLVFQPHLYTRTRDFADEFAQALDQIYAVILLPIYPARELPLDGVTSEMIMQKMKNKNVQILNKENVLEHITHHEYSVVAMVGAGDIETLVQPVKQILLNKA